jgi:jmjN domain
MYANDVVQTMDQFRNFKRFIDKVDKYGMKSGIVKVVPPTEWCVISRMSLHSSRQLITAQARLSARPARGCQVDKSQEPHHPRVYRPARCVHRSKRREATIVQPPGVARCDERAAPSTASEAGRDTHWTESCHRGPISRAVHTICPKGRRR